VDRQRVAREQHLNKPELDQPGQVTAGARVNHGWAGDDDDATARLLDRMHLLRDLTDQHLLRFFGRDLAPHEAEYLGLARTFERGDAHALVADNDLHARLRVLKRNAPGALSLAIHSDRGVHLNLLDLRPAVTEQNLGR